MASDYTFLNAANNNLKVMDLQGYNFMNTIVTLDKIVPRNT